MKDFQLDKIEKGFQWLQAEFEDIDTIQSVDMLIQKLNILNSTLAWAGEQMAIAKFNYNKAKSQAYINLEASNIANGQTKFSPLLAKDFVASSCSQKAYEFDLVERFCRTIVHIADNIRTAISALKEQLKLDMQAERSY